MNRLPPHPDERRRLVRQAGFLALFATALLLGQWSGRRACAAERAEARRAQANADTVLETAHRMADLAEATAAAVWKEDAAIHALPPCRPRAREPVATDGGMEP